MDSNDFVYQKYLADCQSTDSGNLSLSKPAKLLPIPEKSPYWTSSGTAGKFMWRALTSVFTPQVHTIDEKKKKYNDFHDVCRMSGGLRMMSLVRNSLENDPLIAPLLRNVLILNTNVLLTGRPEKVLLDGMFEFLRQNMTLDDSEVFQLTGSQNADIDPDAIQGKDLIFPGLFVVPDNLQQFASVASILCSHGARTCIGVFLTNLVPNEQGQYPPYLPKEMALPLIQGLSFSDLVNMI